MMKPSRIFLFLALLAFLSLSCNLSEATPMVDILPTEIQPAAQVPDSQLPADNQQPASDDQQSPSDSVPPSDQNQPQNQDVVPDATVMTLPTLQNPGFEQGFDHWSELPAAVTYGGASVDENVVSHSGTHSRKLFLRYGGSYIIQRIPENPILMLDPEVPVNSSFTLYVSIKMPYAGTSSNKVFTLELVVGDGNGHTVSAKIDQTAAIPDWGEVYVTLTNPDWPVNWIEVHAMTNKGDGIYKNFDRCVYLDDFKLEIHTP